MNTTTDTGVNRAITFFDGVKVRALHKQAAARLLEQLEAYISDDDHTSCYRLLHRLEYVNGGAATPPSDCMFLRRQAD